jgi:hypothetical protein
MPGVQLKRLIEQRDLQCPAAEVARAGEAVRCRVSREVMLARDNSESIAGFCMVGSADGGHARCPIWRAERDRRTARPLVEG